MKKAATNFQPLNQRKMGNCLKTEASDDESLLGDSDDQAQDQRTRSTRNRRQRRRTRVQGYMAQNQMAIPDPTHYFNLGQFASGLAVFRENLKF